MTIRIWFFGKNISERPVLTHALCNAHHLRDLTAIVENDQQQWAALMISFLLAAKQQVDEARDEGQPALPPEPIERIHRLFDAIVTLGLAENPIPEAKPRVGSVGFSV